MVIDENFKIEKDENNCALVFTELRKHTKGVKAGDEYTFVDEWHYPSVELCLKKYLQISQKDAKDVKECIKITEKAIELIKKL